MKKISGFLYHHVLLFRIVEYHSRPKSVGDHMISLLGNEGGSTCTCASWIEDKRGIFLPLAQAHHAHLMFYTPFCPSNYS